MNIKTINEEVKSLADFKAVLFHTPYCKLVQKSFARLAYNDFRCLSPEAAAALHPSLTAFRDLPLEDTYFNRDIEQAFMASSEEAFLTQTKPSLLLATEVGNMYTPSLYGALASFLAGYSADPDSLVGSRLCLFSYGSGLASTMYSIVIKSGLAQQRLGADVRLPSSNGQAGWSLSQLVSSLSDLQQRLASRQKVPPQIYSDIMKLRESTHHLAPYKPVGCTSSLLPGTWYLTYIDDLHRRQYERVPRSASSSAGAGATATRAAADITGAETAAKIPKCIETNVFGVTQALTTEISEANATAKVASIAGRTPPES
ncbi:hypothetical protein HAZT_HAZT004306 [Hyalella azteca]|uniref:Hydroxymethylglutaryl-coenzyme A synthase C-terminal domain-containing protein n=1 Tax=Hyalella azteca TaxID=294128 RepID=A0A6A0H206_HYAAZ|nr:hypothetical protein HAZT_HAZT004306 [Hyalella azteca]